MSNAGGGNSTDVGEGMKLLKPYMEKRDERGGVLGLFNQFPLEEVNLISSVKGAIRGNHYHINTREFFYLVSGEIHLSVMTTDQNVVFDDVLTTGSIFIIEPYEVHTVTALSDAQWINGLDRLFSDKNPDFHVVV